MASILKVSLLAATAYFGYHLMTNGWGGGAEMPRSMMGLVRQAKVLDKKLVVLITGSDWCPACQSMDRGMLSTPEWQSYAAKQIVFQKYEYPNGGEAPTPAHQDLLKLPGFHGFPTMVVVNGNGKVLDMKTGYGGGTQEYARWIDSL